MEGERQARPSALAIVIATLIGGWLIVTGVCSDDFGPTWDEVKGDIPLGHQRLEYLLELDHSWLDSGRAGDIPARAPHLAAPHDSYSPQMVFSLGGILSALCCKVLWTGLGIVPAVAAHHLIAPLFTALLIVLGGVFIGRRLGAFAALAAGLLLLTSPRFFTDAQNNIKDVPETCLYLAAVFAGAQALRSGGLRWYAGTGVLIALAVAQKMNGVFAPIQLAVWLLVLLPSAAGRRAIAWRKVLAGVLVASACFAPALLIASPHWWHDPIGELSAQIAYSKHIGNLTLQIAVPAPDGGSVLLPIVERWHGAVEAFLTTPLPILVLMIAGLFARRLAGPDRALLLVSVLVPVLRTALPGMRNYDGVRHFLEFFPAACILAAAGLDEIRARIVATLPRLRLVAPSLVLIAVALPGFIATVHTYPYGTCWYNPLAGGVAGARQRGLDAFDYWGLSNWEALDWLNEHAPRNARIVVPVGDQIVLAAAPVKLRSDLAIASFEQIPPDVACIVLLLVKPGLYDAGTRHLVRTVTPTHVIACEGEPIHELFQLDRVEIDAILRAQEESRLARVRLDAWIVAHPQLGKGVYALLLWHGQLGPRRAIELLDGLLPPELHASARLLVE